MKSIDDVKTVLQELLGKELSIGTDTKLREDLNLDSANLIELTVMMHGKFGVDIGRKAAEKRLNPESVGDLIQLLNE